MLICPLQRPQWQNSIQFSFLTYHLDTIMATHYCQNAIIVGDSNQHLVRRAFTELRAIHGITSHVNFVTHMRVATMDPVLGT